MRSIIITEMQDSDRSAWDAFVAKSECSLPNQLSGWRDIMAGTYGFETHYLLAREGQQVVGILPLLIVRSALVGSRALSLPGGLCSERLDVAQALIAAGKEAAEQAHVKQLVLQDTRQVWPGDLATSTGHMSWRVDLSASPEAIWKNLNPNVRRCIRRAREQELRVEIDSTGEHLDKCYDVLTRFTHHLGTPFFGYGFLARVVETFPDQITVSVVYAGQEPAAAYFGLSMRGILWGLWGGTLHEHRDKKAGFLAYWEILSYAARSGYRFWDLGRSPVGSGVSRFKKEWNSFSTPVYQQVAGIGGHEPADSVASRVQADGRMKRFAQIWPWLPLPLARYLGPRLRRHVPFA
jgi:FemAB-related protein (PEP-CTERM system-associated)